jgi:hypothetical protein
MWKSAKVHAPCSAPGCTKSGNFARNFCSTHYLEFRKACRENGSWYSGTPLASPIVIEKFEWQGDEDSLAAMCEKNERLKTLKVVQQERDAAYERDSKLKS